MSERWVTVFALTRLLATATAIALLLVRPAREYDTLFALIAFGYGIGTTALVTARPALGARPVVWVVDATVLLGLAFLAGEWRSPFYLLAVSSLILPATSLSFANAMWAGTAFTITYVGISFVTGLTIAGLDSTARLESLATHVLMPLLVTFAFAYATMLLRKLEGERERSERLAIETERRRIAWELHDSSKQRVHAAHLVLSHLPARLEGAQRAAVEQAIAELSNAATDMDASLWELRAPLSTDRLDGRLRTRAAELSAATEATISVRGDGGEMPGWISTHVYRIASEALTNALRHSSPRNVVIELGRDHDVMSLSVADDGTGVDSEKQRRSGLESMSARAKAINARLAIGAGPDGRGTLVRLEVPMQPDKGVKA